MINFYLDRFVHHWRDLVRALREAEAAVKIDRNAEVPASGIDQIDEWIKGGIRYCVNAIGIREAELTKVDLEIQLGNRHFQPIIWGELFENLKRLCDQIIVGISRECFFHYTRENGILIFRAEQNWSVVIGRFPSAKQEILPGIDCYALRRDGHPNNVQKALIERAARLMLYIEQMDARAIAAGTMTAHDSRQ